MRSIYLALLLLISGCVESTRAVTDPIEEEVKTDIFTVRDGPWPTNCNVLIPYYGGAKNPSREAALTEIESACNQFAQSPYAKGYRQFTDDTGKWLAQTHCSHLGSYQPFNTDWQMRCGIIYSELKEADNDFPAQNGDSYYCTNRKIGESEYNGGHWIIWELELVGGDLLEAQRICGKQVLKNGRKRAVWACDENYNYFKKISDKQPKYMSLGGIQCF